MSKVSFSLISVFVSLAILISGPAYAADKDARILFVNTVGQKLDDGTLLPEIVFEPAGYMNVTTVTTMADFEAAWADRGSYDVLLFAYHSFNIGGMAAWLEAEVSNLEAWVNSGGIFVGTAGRDEAELPIATAFGLSVSNPGGASQALLVLEPGHPIAADIPDGALDASKHGATTPVNGEIYDAPLPAWASVVGRDSAGEVITVAGRYGNGVLWLAAGFEIQNIHAGGDATSSMLPGYREIWANFLNWATEVAIVEPASKLTSTWGNIKSDQLSAL